MTLSESFPVILELVVRDDVHALDEGTEHDRVDHGLADLLDGDPVGIEGVALDVGHEGVLELLGGPRVVGEDDGVLLDAPGDVDFTDERPVHDDDHIGLVDLAVDPDGCIGDPGETPDGRSHPLGSELREGLDVHSRGYGGLGEDLVRCDDTLSAPTMPANLHVHWYH